MPLPQPLRIDELLGKGLPSISFEFFPPRTEDGFASLYRAIDELRPLEPTFVSVTYGAGGSTRQKTGGTRLGASSRTALPVSGRPSAGMSSTTSGPSRRCSTSAGRSSP